MSIALIVTRGYGNGTLTGSIANIVTRGYTIGQQVVQPAESNTITLLSNTARITMAKSQRSR